MIFDLLRQRRKTQPKVQMKDTTRSFPSFASSPKFERRIELRLRRLTSKFLKRLGVLPHALDVRTVAFMGRRSIVCCSWLLSWSV